MNFSMMTYTMIQQEYKLDEIFRTAQDLKMAGIDWVTTYDLSAKEAKKRSDDAGLPVVAYTFFYSNILDKEKSREETKRELEKAEILNTPTVMIVPCSEVKLGVRDEARGHWIELLQEVCPLFHKAGICPTIENFQGPDSPFVTAADFLNTHAIVPDLYLTFDNGNAGSAEDPAESLKRTFDYVRHVHLKDWQRVDVETPGYRQLIDGRWYRPALIGDGVIDSKETVRILKEKGYTGYINLEYEAKEIPAPIALKRVLDTLRSI